MHSPLLLSLGFPIVEEFLEAGIRERVFKEGLEYTVGHRADVPSCQGCLHDVLWMADASHEYQRLVIIVLINCQDLPDKLHAV